MLNQEIKDNVAVLSIARPERRNAMSLGLAREIRKLLEALDKAPAVKAIVLRGEQHGFCAGSDLKELSDFSLEQIAEAEREKATVARSINFMDTPVIAAVDGFAIGGGLVYAISCDVVFTAREACWHLPEVELGWNPGWGVKALLSRVGPVAARHLCWGVDPIDGVEAQRLGVADFVAEEDAYSAALTYAKKLAGLPHHAVVATKRLCAPVAGENGQVLDLTANRLFAESCDHEIARSSYRRFGVNV